jgi:hypothetical protein
MSWASERKTTRTEDIAYCLLGIFGVNMALLYGEGERAFIRLQEEIMKASDDHSLFAWIAKSSDPRTSRGLLATSPEEFQEAGSISSCHDWTKSSLPYAMTNKGLRITLSLGLPSEENVYVAPLNCLETNSTNVTLAIYLKQLSSVGDQYVRVRPNELTYSIGRVYRLAQTIYVRQTTPVLQPETFHQAQKFLIRTQFGNFSHLGYTLSNIDTPEGPMSPKRSYPGLQLPIPQGCNGWIAALWFKRREVKNTDTFCVLLGFTPHFGASVRIVLPQKNQNPKDLFRIFNPTAPSVLESFLLHESKSQSGELYKTKEKLYIDLGLDRQSGEKIYVVHIVMES